MFFWELNTDWFIQEHFSTHATFIILMQQLKYMLSLMLVQGVKLVCPSDSDCYIHFFCGSLSVACYQDSIYIRYTKANRVSSGITNAVGKLTSNPGIHILFDMYAFTTYVYILSEHKNYMNVLHQSKHFCPKYSNSVQVQLVQDAYRFWSISMNRVLQVEEDAVPSGMLFSTFFFTCT